MSYIYTLAHYLYAKQANILNQQNTMQKGNIGITTENIFPVIKKFLYSDHEIFLREIVSNAVDATQKLKTLAMKGDFKGELGDLTVHVAVDKEAKTLTISDRGIGMTAEEIDKYINQIAFSGANDFLENTKMMRLPSSDILAWAFTHHSWWLTVLTSSHAATEMTPKV